MKQMRYERNGCYSSSNNLNKVSNQIRTIQIYFSNLLQLQQDGSIVDRDLEIYAKHLKNLSED